jgi:hypothetical protein
MAVGGPERPMRAGRVESARLPAAQQPRLLRPILGVAG